MKISTLPLIFLLFLLLLGCSKSNKIEIEAGVTKKLAEYRASSISDITYHLYFSIPENKEEAIPAEMKINFKLQNIDNPIILDFRESRVNIKKIRIDNKSISYTIAFDHILIASDNLKKGEHTIEIDFFAGKHSLNWNTDFLYTLFVPDRACTAFPCFDQPTMKAIFNLQLEIPAKWQAVSNGSIENEQTLDARKMITFTPSALLSTYLFSFAAGNFQIASQKHNGRIYRLFHRETDSVKLNRNLPEIFGLLFHSIDWLEEYTAITYPFQKYDLVSIPSFQYSGMEHPGAVLYRESKLFLDENASRKQQLVRANLIAHETSHIWFGDLVTMKWFDEVWLKEVFANYIADKIIQPFYTDINHDLQFIVAHYPLAYEIDRSQGANPVSQDLENLNQAGSIYGNIIYHKAPIVMSKLEEITGKQILKKGLQEYLKKFAFSNASWNDLIQILDSQTPYDLAEWSKNWVYEAGMPMYEISGTEKKVLVQNDPQNKNRIWPQNLAIKQGKDEMKIHTAFKFQTLGFENKENDTFLLNSTGKGYGYFKMTKIEIANCSKELRDLKDPVQRVSIWINLYENMLNKQFSSIQFYETIINQLEVESNDLILNLILGYLNTTFDKFLPEDYCLQNQSKLENLLWKRLQKCAKSQKREYFKTYLQLFKTNDALKKVEELWNEKRKIEGLTFSADDFVEMCCELAVREYPYPSFLFSKQMEKLTNKDKKERLLFIWPALSASDMERNSFFESLKKVSKRKHEVWTETALAYLNRPLQNRSSTKFLKPGLELLQEIQRTGDIFFPQAWLNALLKGQNSQQAKQIVMDFLEQNPNYSPKLRLKILQSADLLIRAPEIKAFNREIFLGTKF